MMKKYSAILISMGLILSLAGCGGNEQTKPADGTYVQPVSTEAPVTQPAPAETESFSEMPEPSEGDDETTEAETTPENTDPEIISTGYGPGESEPAESGQTVGIFEESDLTTVYLGAAVRVGEAFDYTEYLEVWGEPEIEKGQACIGGGFDMNYYYGDGFSIYTLGEGEAQVIYDIYLTEEGYATPKGAVIGTTTRDELAQLYGMPDASMGATDRYQKDGVILSFTFSGGILSDIDYNDSNLY